MAEIVHIALVKLDAHHDDALARDHVVDHARRVLTRLPGVERVTVGRALPDVIALTAQAHPHHGPPPERKWDLCFELRFASAAAHDRFRVDPDRLAFFDQFLGPQAAAVKAWSFEVLEDPYPG
ncbi:MAG: hypothetical protein IT385_02740 [Deltaproteobacteria bacterium]|nr:hypothetical protein [Deltaproteobacteria bacterium]